MKEGEVSAENGAYTIFKKVITGHYYKNVVKTVSELPSNQFESFSVVPYLAGKLYDCVITFKIGIGKKYQLVLFGGTELISYGCNFLENFSLWAAEKGHLPVMAVISIDQISVLVKEEIDRATSLFPVWPQNQFEALSILSEEIGEVHKALLDLKHKSGPAEDVITETVQFIAMACRFLFGFVESLKGDGGEV